MPNYEEDFGYTRRYDRKRRQRHSSDGSCSSTRKKSISRNRSRSPYLRRQRRYRGSSGTRALRRSYDRAIRLKEYYETKYASGQRGSENHGNRKDNIKRNGNSFDYRSSYSNNNRKSRSASSSDTRHSANSSHHIKDDKDGHLIYKVGDWLQNRCTKHFL